LKSGGLVVYPTETAYALGCDPKSPKAVKRLFSVKQRDAAKRLPMIAASTAMAMRHLKLDRYGRILAKAFWPGPLTLVAPVAMRVSPHPWASALSKALGRPVISTSANRSGRATVYDIPSVLKDLGAMPDLVLDAGRLKPSPVSTIVRPSGGAMEILREGAVSEEALQRAMMKSL